ncbi:Mitochondrial distribution and morphology protein 31, mitochondrial precursor [Borealophlyctis nickersoniae]|nr:Mitochondrial distribution and morphology protein 31, mitochondrial precursor [Borealophlyctis nickersoniae]
MPTASQGQKAQITGLMLFAGALSPRFARAYNIRPFLSSRLVPWGARPQCQNDLSRRFFSTRRTGANPNASSSSSEKCRRTNPNFQQFHSSRPFLFPFASRFFSRGPSSPFRLLTQPTAWRVFASRQYSAASDATKAFLAARRALVAQVQGFWPRLRLRVRLFLTGQVRPWKMDDILALGSWIFVGHTVFILAGTTTFVSLVIAVINSLQFQEYFAQRVSDYLTHETGWKVMFESAIVPRWADGRIRLDNVSLVCNADTWKEWKKMDRAKRGLAPLTDEEIDTNFTYWDMTIRHVDVSLSLWQWLDGRGLVTKCTLKGVRGVSTIPKDRRHIWWDPEWTPTRRVAQMGDFEIGDFVVEDFLVTVLNPEFRPYTISIFNAELPRLRKQWLLYDFMRADSITGMFDNCLFSVHKPQRHDIVLEDGAHGEWAKISHLKINGVPIEHLNRGSTGPFGWITRGTLDVDLQLLFPQTQGADILNLIKEEIEEMKDSALDKIEEVISKNGERRSHQEKEHSQRTTRSTTAEASSTPGLATSAPVRPSGRVDLFPSQSYRVEDDPSLDAIPSSKQDPQLVMVWNVRLNDLKAAVPLSTPHLSYMNNALIRPIVAYMNAVRTSIAISFSAKMNQSKFDGAWTVYSAGLVDVLGEEVGRAVANMVQNDRERARHLKRIGIWSLQSVTRNIMSLVDYARGTKGFEHFAGLTQESGFGRASWVHGHAF